MARDYAIPDTAGSPVARIEELRALAPEAELRHLLKLHAAHPLNALSRLAATLDHAGLRLGALEADGEGAIACTLLDDGADLGALRLGLQDCELELLDWVTELG